MKNYNKGLALNKRKRSLLRKLMELSTLCGQKISFKMLDPDSHTLVIYNSKEPLNEGDLDVNLDYEIYEDCDYDDLSGKFLKADTMERI